MITRIMECSDKKFVQVPDLKFEGRIVGLEHTGIDSTDFDASERFAEFCHSASNLQLQYSEYELKNAFMRSIGKSVNKMELDAIKEVFDRALFEIKGHMDKRDIDNKDNITTIPNDANNWND